MGFGKKRILTHIKGESGVDILKSYFPEEWVVREYNPDYGIDLSVELFEPFEDGYITSGEHIFFQVKNTDDIKKANLKIKSRMNVEKEYRQVGERETKEIEVVKFVLDTNELYMVEKMGSAAPVILAVVDNKLNDVYFICLNDYIEKVIVPDDSDYNKQETKTIYIPITNKLNNEDGIRILKWYAKRPKLYALFNKINYQNRELQYATQYDTEKLISHFLKILLRSDAWSAADYFGAMYVAKEQIDYYIEHGITEDAERRIKNSTEECDIDEKLWEGTYCIGEVSLREVIITQSMHALWDNLCLMGNIFEDIAKESFLPTYLGVSM